MGTRAVNWTSGFPAAFFTTLAPSLSSLEAASSLIALTLGYQASLNSVPAIYYTIRRISRTKAPLHALCTGLAPLDRDDGLTPSPSAVSFWHHGGPMFTWYEKARTP